MASLRGKVIAVTGGMSGMGLAICHRLTQLGARATCIGDYNMSNEATIVKDLQKHGSDTEILTTQLNVASSSSVNAWYSRIISKYGALDGVVNSAGVAQKVGGREQPELLGETDEEWERIMGINLNGVFFSTRSAAKAMVALPKAPRSIVNIASLAAWLNSPGVYAYSTSKRAVAGLTPSMAKDLQPFGIRLNTILPSSTSTPMLGQFFDLPKDGEMPSTVGGQRVVSADDIARVAIWLLSDDSADVWGSTIPVGGTAP